MWWCGDTPINTEQDYCQFINLDYVVEEVVAYLITPRSLSRFTYPLLTNRTQLPVGAFRVRCYVSTTLTNLMLHRGDRLRKEVIWRVFDLYLYYGVQFKTHSNLFVHLK